MCAVTAVLESRAVAVNEPVTSMVIDTAVGTVRAEARVSDARVEDVTVANVPAYVVALDHKLDVRFVGRLAGETSVAGRPAVLPTITGRTWVTGRSLWTLQETDPFPEGYTLGDIWTP
jgi:proline racemase